jgi:peptide/nickel transport system permease protein
MLVFTVRRLLQAIPILLVSSFISFWLASVSGDPVANLFAAKNPPPSPTVIAAEYHYMRLDKPWLAQFGEYIWNLVTKFDFGPSIQGTGFVVRSQLGSALAVTLRLVLAAMLLALVLALITGVFSAYRQYSKMDYSFTFAGFVFLAMPTFWIASLLKLGAINFNDATQSAFGGKRIIPMLGQESDPANLPHDLMGKLGDWATHLILPTLSLALITYAAWSRFCRGSLLEVLNSDYIRLARAKGLTPRRVMLRHALRTALIPMTTVTSLTIATIFGGAIITEDVFQWRGMGTIIINAILSRDRFVIMGWLLITGFIVIVGNIVADLLYAILDPRIRYE